MQDRIKRQKRGRRVHRLIVPSVTASDAERLVLTKTINPDNRKNKKKSWSRGFFNDNHTRWHQESRWQISWQSWRIQLQRVCLGLSRIEDDDHIADRFIQILIPRILTVMAIPAMKRLASPQRQMLEGSITRL